MNKVVELQIHEVTLESRVLLVRFDREGISHFSTIRAADWSRVLLVRFDPQGISHFLNDASCGLVADAWIRHDQNQR